MAKDTEFQDHIDLEVYPDNGKKLYNELVSSLNKYLSASDLKVVINRAFFPEKLDNIIGQGTHKEKIQQVLNYSMNHKSLGIFLTEAKRHNTVCLDQVTEPLPKKPSIFFWKKKYLILVGIIPLITMTFVIGNYMDKKEKPLVEKKYKNYQVKYKMLVIANKDYSNSAWESLTTPIQDAQDFIKVMKEKYGVKEGGSITFIPNANESMINRAFNKFAETVTDEDSVIIYYSGHGAVNDRFVYWVPVDGTNEPTTWVSNVAIVDHLKYIAARALHVLLISDSCFSGQLVKGGEPNVENSYFDKYYFDRSCEIIASADGLAVDNYKRTGNSPFARELIKILKKPNGEDLYSSSQVFQKIEENIDSSQKPIYGKVEKPNNKGKFFFLKFIEEPLIDQTDEEKKFRTIKIRSANNKNFAVSLFIIKNEKMELKEIETLTIRSFTESWKIDTMDGLERRENEFFINDAQKPFKMILEPVELAIEDYSVAAEGKDDNLTAAYFNTIQQKRKIIHGGGKCRVSIIIQGEFFFTQSQLSPIEVKAEKNVVYFHDRSIKLSKVEFEGIENVSIEVNNKVYRIKDAKGTSLDFHSSNNSFISTYGFRFGSNETYYFSKRNATQWSLTSTKEHLFLEQFSLYGENEEKTPVSLEISKHFAKLFGNEISSVSILNIKCKKIVFYFCESPLVNHLFESN